MRRFFVCESGCGGVRVYFGCCSIGVARVECLVVLGLMISNGDIWN